MAVPQTYQDVIDILGTAVNRSDLQAKYIDFINRAVRDIAAAHSFDQLGNKATVNFGSGQNLVVLPADFKDLQPGRFTYAAIGGGAVVPVPIYRKEEVERIQSVFMPAYYLIYSSDGNAFQLGLLPGALTAAAWVITLYYFAYPAPVTDPTQTTPLLVFYPNLVLARTLSLIFQSINDPIWEEHEKSYQVQLAQFTGADIRISSIKVVKSEKS